VPRKLEKQWPADLSEPAEDTEINSIHLQDW
jgi:hypothetical protein